MVFALVGLKPEHFLVRSLVQLTVSKLKPKANRSFKMSVIQHGRQDWKKYVFDFEILI